MVQTIEFTTINVFEQCLDFPETTNPLIYFSLFLPLRISVTVPNQLKVCGYKISFGENMPCAEDVEGRESSIIDESAQTVVVTMPSNDPAQCGSEGTFTAKFKVPA